MSKCLVCGRNYESFLNIFKMTPPFCSKCLHKEEEPLSFEEVQGHQLTYLHTYSKERMGMLIGLKGNGEKAFKDILIPSSTRKQLRRRYWNATFVYMPSTKEADEERGFTHLSVLFEGIAKESYYPLYKKSNYKQASLSYQERLNVKQRLGVNKELLPSLIGKRIVLVDDVITSGATLLAASELLHLKEVEWLVVLREASNFDE